MKHILPVVVLALAVLILPHGTSETIALGVLLVVGGLTIARVFAR